MTPIRRMLATIATAAVLALATACGAPAAGPTAGPAAPSSAPAPAAPAPAASAPATSTGATTVTVTMTDFKLALDRSGLAPGAYVFHAVNAGQHGHALEVEGPGIEEQKTAIVAPGQSADLMVTLPKGSFEMYCPVGNHRQMGMTLDLTVG